MYIVSITRGEEIGITVFHCVFCVLIVWIMYDDYRRDRILNRAILIGLLLGMGRAVYHQGIQGIPFSLSGIIIPFLLLFIFYLFHMMGAGDIKLFMMIGAFVGPKDIREVMWTAFLIGAVIALFKMLAHRTVVIRFFYLWNYLYRTITTRKLEPYYQKEELESKNRIHFAIPIGLSTFLWMGGMFL